MIALRAVVLRDLLRIPDLRLEAGDGWWIQGSSGSGKSQFLRMLAGLRTPDEGEVLREVPKLGLASRTAGLLANLGLMDNVTLPLRFSGVSRAEAEGRAEGILQRLEIAESGRLRPHLLGDRSRKLGLLARAWAWDPPVLLVDEPFEDLEDEDEAILMAVFREWRGEGRAVVVASDQGPSEGWRNFVIEDGLMTEDQACS